MASRVDVEVLLICSKCGAVLTASSDGYARRHHIVAPILRVKPHVCGDVTTGAPDDYEQEPPEG